jgi:2-polyprenyl-3-methyl-5-hydroxy-6-metoxy-1,4-benzoquinol methylase
MADMNADTSVWYYGESKRKEIVHLIPEGVRSMLDIGCGCGAFGGYVKSIKNIEVDGVELNSLAAKQAATKLRQVHVIDIDREPNWAPGQTYDLITLLDVLEHLQDPWSMLQRAAKWLSHNGYLLATIPNLRYYEVLKEILLAKTFRYQDSGVLDRTHLRFFTESTALELFASSNYTVVHHERINGLPFPWKYGLLNQLLLGSLEDTRYPQFAFLTQYRSA